MSDIKIDPSWKQRLGAEFEKDYMKGLRSFLVAEYQKGKKIYPSCDNYFKAFNTTSFDKIKVVIIGQDPYHGPGQAHGLCFSVQKGVPPPPSLINIFKEMKSDLGEEIPSHGCLTDWAEQGVLLLNAVLTVEEGKAGAHSGRGWEQFTDQVISMLNEQKEGLVFLLLGNYAQKKAAFVNREKHFVLEIPHPSPLSAYRGFFGSKPFSRINNYLKSKGVSPIDWKIR